MTAPKRAACDTQRTTCTAACLRHLPCAPSIGVPQRAPCHATYCNVHTTCHIRRPPITWHAASWATCNTWRKSAQHATHDEKTRRARTHSNGAREVHASARDRAALERYDPIVHANNAAATLRTADAAIPATNRSRIPSADTRSKPETRNRAPARRASPPRPAPHPCSGAEYRHGVE